jgi:unsaturated rhamnogalacturonyl hydrolase
VSSAIVDAAEVAPLMARVARFELAGLAPSPRNDWTRAVFYVGVMEAYLATGEPFYRDACRRWAEAAGWKLHPADRPRFADDQACCQVYLDLFLLDPGPASAPMIADARRVFDAMIAEPRPGRVDWWWCDALFMAPPVLVRLAAATGDGRYLELLDGMFWDTTLALFSPREGLFYRDARFVGGPVFWSRGNGWVAAGVARVLQHLPPAHPGRGRYEDLLRTLAAAAVRHQGEDGFWRSDLLAPSAFPNPESSGTALFTAALAWGVGAGILDRARHAPVIRRAWNALAGVVSTEGRLGWVQAVGHQPGPAGPEDHMPFGPGALLLAGSALLGASRAALYAPG